MWRILFALVLVGSVGCSQLAAARSRPAHGRESEIELAAYSDEPAARTVYVISNGFHAGLVVHRDDVPRDVWPEIDEVPAHPWVEIGWGSEIFYRAEKITVPVVVGAVLPNSSVLHVVGWDQSPEELFKGGDVIRLEVDETHFAELCRHVHETYAYDEQGHAQDLGRGIYGDSRFFRAKGKYYFPNTCNVWTARGLKAAGLPVVPELCAAADALLVAVRGSGTTIRKR